MELSVAVNLIWQGVPSSSAPQMWADLGAGNGLFTKALAACLPAHSTVHAVDRDGRALDAITWKQADVSLVKQQVELEEYTVSNGTMDGFILANSLHYIPRQKALLDRLFNMLKPQGQLILVEYDKEQSNPWVPFPVAFDALTKLVGQSEFKTVKKLGAIPSVYNSNMMYAAVVSK